jgi:hypothetical protein
MQKVKRSCRKLAQKLSYMDTLWEEHDILRAVGWHDFGFFEDTSWFV